ncbi:hypothetical protein Tco_0147218 [Tanacetum coccineum]
MSSASVYSSPPQDDPHRKDHLDLLGEWQNIYKEFEDCLSWSDKVDIVVLVQKLGWLELDEHAKYDLTYSRVLAKLHLQSSFPYQLDSMSVLVLNNNKMCCDIDDVSFGKDDDGVQDEDFGSVFVNS